MARTSRFSSHFCTECGAGVVEINRAMGRLVVPLCRDPEASCAIFPVSRDDGEPPFDMSRALRAFDAQLELLRQASHYRTSYLVISLRLLHKPPIPLEAYLRDVATLRADVFQPAAALEELMGAFSDHLLDAPHESPALAVRVERAGLEFARVFAEDGAEGFMQKGPAFVRWVASRWSWRVIEEILPIPTCVDPDDVRVLERRSHTVRALQDAAFRQVVRAYGPPRRPEAPSMGPRTPHVVLADSGARRPDHFPEACPRTARFVVGLEGSPADPEAPLYVYQLSMDRRHRWWILWAVPAGWVVPVPAAWCPRGGLTPVEAAFSLLEASLARDLERRGPGCPRPSFAMDGVFGEDLADVLLDRVWLGI